MWGWQRTEEGTVTCGTTRGLLGKHKDAGWSNSVAAIRVSCKGVSRKSRWGTKLQVVGTKPTAPLDTLWWFLKYLKIFISDAAMRLHVVMHRCCIFVCIRVCIWYTLGIPASACMFRRGSRSVSKSLPSQGLKQGVSLNLVLTDSAWRASLEGKGYWGGLKDYSLASLSAYLASCSTMV